MRGRASDIINSLWFCYELHKQHIAINIHLPLMYIPLEKRDNCVILDKSIPKYTDYTGVSRDLGKHINSPVFLGKQSNTMSKAPKYLINGVKKSFS